MNAIFHQMTHAWAISGHGALAIGLDRLRPAAHLRPSFIALTKMTDLDLKGCVGAGFRLALHPGLSVHAGRSAFAR